jgi:hypothetical protein
MLPSCLAITRHSFDIQGDCGERREHTDSSEKCQQIRPASIPLKRKMNHAVVQTHSTTSRSHPGMSTHLLAYRVRQSFIALPPERGRDRMRAMLLRGAKSALLRRTMLGTAGMA